MRIRLTTTTAETSLDPAGPWSRVRPAELGFRRTRSLTPKVHSLLVAICLQKKEPRLWSAATALPEEDDVRVESASCLRGWEGDKSRSARHIRWLISHAPAARVHSYTDDHQKWLRCGFPQDSIELRDTAGLITWLMTCDDCRERAAAWLEERPVQPSSPDPVDVDAAIETAEGEISEGLFADACERLQGVQLRASRAHPDQWFRLWRAVGTARFRLADRAEMPFADLSRARLAYSAAVQVTPTRPDLAKLVADTRLNEVATLLKVAQLRDRKRNLEAAETILRAVRSRLAPKSADAGRADSLLAILCLLKAERERAKAAQKTLLAMAERALRASVTSRERRKDRRDHAADLQVLSSVLKRRADHGATKRRLQESIQLLERAVHLAADAPPLNDLVRYTLSLGTAWLMLAPHDSVVTCTQRAIEAFDDARTFVDRDRAPMQWAQATHNAGAGRLHLAAATGDVQPAKEAIELFRSALTIRQPERVPAPAALTLSSLGSAQRIVAGEDPELLATARQSLLQARLLDSIDTRVHTRVDIDAELARTELALGIIQQDTHHVRSALHDMRLCVSRRASAGVSDVAGLQADMKRGRAWLRARRVTIRPDQQ